MKEHVEVAPDVADALAKGLPVVALESTLIAQGLPFPLNIETALASQDGVRQRGAVPATVAAVDGKLKVGLSQADLHRLAEPDVAKVGSGDLGPAIAGGGVGATTVSATLVAADAAGISVFATGGIGGVHRGAAESFDVSADLEELGRRPVVVVCAGAKAILDLAATLEYLETRGVPVIGYSTNELPAFYSSASGLRLRHRCDSTEEVARVARAHWDLALRTSVVVANPPPPERALDPGLADAALRQALLDADKAGITGQAATPFLLARIADLTDGASVEANVALIKANARLAADIASAL